MSPEGTWDELPCEWGVESERSPRGGHGMSSHVSGGRRVGDYPGGGHGMSSHVSGGRRQGRGINKPLPPLGDIG